MKEEVCGEVQNTVAELDGETEEGERKDEGRDGITANGTRRDGCYEIVTNKGRRLSRWQNHRALEQRKQLNI